MLVKTSSSSMRQQILTIKRNFPFYSQYRYVHHFSYVNSSKIHLLGNLIPSSSRKNAIIHKKFLSHDCNGRDSGSGSADQYFNKQDCLPGVNSPIKKSLIEIDTSIQNVKIFHFNAFYSKRYPNTLGTIKTLTCQNQKYSQDVRHFDKQTINHDNYTEKFKLTNDSTANNSINDGNNINNGDGSNSNLGGSNLDSNSGNSNSYLGAGGVSSSGGGSSGSSGSSNTTRSYLLYSIVGIGFAILYGVYEEIMDIFSHKITTKIELNDRDEAFTWVMYWLSHAPYTNQSCSHFSVLSTSYGKGAFSFLNYLFPNSASSREDDVVEDEDMGHVTGERLGDEHVEKNGSKFKKILYVPSTGKHYFQYDGRLMMLEYTKNDTNNNNHSSSSNNLSSSQQITLTVLGSGKKQKTFLKRIIDEAQKMYISKKHGKTCIYQPDYLFDHWEEIAKKPKRNLNSVVLQNETMDQLLSDVKQFVESESFYEDRGIPYRRAYLLYGPPGTGKTSTVMAVAGKMGYDICIVNAQSKALTDEKLAYLMHQAPKNSIILFEDIDSCRSSLENIHRSKEHFQESANEDDEEHVEHQQGVSVSGLLNLIDGVASQTGKIIFFTTNNPHLLSRAFSRPGRIDRKFYLGFASTDQARKLFLQFYCNQEREQEELRHLSETFIKKLEKRLKMNGKGITPAGLQGYFMQFQNDPEGLIQDIDGTSNTSNSSLLQEFTTDIEGSNIKQ